jgi:hypothetical protein
MRIRETLEEVGATTSIDSLLSFACHSYAKSDSGPP